MAAIDPPLKVLPLGGLGEIGMNCMLIGHAGRWVMVDCGVQFPDVAEIGVERRLPDVRFLEGWQGRVDAIVLTHGHEDHIGALSWALGALGDVPIHASPFTRELVRHRLRERGMWSDSRVVTFRAGDRFRAGPFEIEALRVTHSLPDCCSLVLRCEAGTIVHTGDWKIDPDPMDGEGFDAAGFERVGDEGVTLLLSDSTNALTPGRTRGERAVAAALEEEVATWAGRVVVAQFASNLHRLTGLADAAEAHGRRIVFAGNSLHRYLEAAAAVGRAPIEPGKVVDIADAGRIPPEQQLIVCAGSQGEPLAALTRAATGAHRHLHLGRGDLVLHSARVIPGNERAVYRMFNDLARRGCTLVYGRRSAIHASGHACEDELREMLRLVRPHHFVPVHGEYTFLRRHAELAEQEGIRSVTVVENGEVLGVEPVGDDGATEIRRIALEELEILFNDGPATGDREEMRLTERLKVAWNGVLVVDVALGGAGGPEIGVESRAIWTDDGELLEVARDTAARTIGAVPKGTPRRELREAIAASVRTAIRRRIGKRPEVVVILHAGRVA